MIHGNGASCELSVLIVHDSLNNGKGGERASISVSGDLSDAAVFDDPTNTGTFNDTYIYDVTTDATNIQWAWGSCCTDGVADIADLDSIGECVTVTNVTFERGIDRWVYVAGPLQEDSATENDYIDLVEAKHLKCVVLTARASVADSSNDNG